MIYRAMHSAASGMESQLLNLDTISNNLANAGTTGFKRSRTNFEDLFYDHFKVPGQDDAQGTQTAVGISFGVGTRVSSTQVDHGGGTPLQTGNQTDIAIQGDGFFQVQDNGRILYTRAGNFTVNPDGQLVLASANRGRLIDPPITIPNDTLDISISGDGVVSVLQAGAQQAVQVGNIELARFINPQGLLQQGDNLFAQTDASGDPQIGTPTTEGRGTLLQGFLESSNVEPVRELIDLIKTQRNVELNSNVVQASDQLLQMVVNLRRF